MKATDRADDVGDVLDEAATALYVRGDLQDGRRLFGHAFELAELAADAERLASAAVGFAGLRVHEHRSSTGNALLRVRLAQALAGVDATSAVGVRLRSRLAAEEDYC